MGTEGFIILVSIHLHTGKFSILERKGGKGRRVTISLRISGQVKEGKNITDGGGSNSKESVLEQRRRLPKQRHWEKDSGHSSEGLNGAAFAQDTSSPLPDPASKPPTQCCTPPSGRYLSMPRAILEVTGSREQRRDWLKSQKNKLLLP